MNQNKEVVYFDSSENQNDTFTIINEEELITEASLERQENYKKRHKNDIYAVSKIRRIIDTFMPAVIVAFIVFLIFQFILLNGTVPSGSMESTIMTGNLILTNRLAYISDEPETGEVIVFWSDEYQKLLVKRVIGTAGDVILLKDGDVYINDKLVYEEYIQGETWSASKENQTFSVPEGKLFVLGDNRENSGDSRFFSETFIDINDVKGEVFLHYSLGGDDGVYAEVVHSEAPICLVK